MALSSASTITEIKAQYADNAGYDVNGSVSEAKLFIEACRHLKRLTPMEAGDGVGRVKIDTKLIGEELEAAVAWLSGVGGFPAVSGASGVSSTVFSDTEGFRD